ncbi:hypothetical protein SFRURICE_003227, partial [Spodoptera frugiperda]
MVSRGHKCNHTGHILLIIAICNVTAFILERVGRGAHYGTLIIKRITKEQIYSSRAKMLNDLEKGKEKDFLLCRGCAYKDTSSHTHDTEIRNKNLWIARSVAPYGNQTRYTYVARQSVAQPPRQPFKVTTIKDKTLEDHGLRLTSGTRLLKRPFVWKKKQQHKLSHIILKKETLPYASIFSCVIDPKQEFVDHTKSCSGIKPATRCEAAGCPATTPTVQSIQQIHITLYQQKARDDKSSLEYEQQFTIKFSLVATALT